MTIANRVLGYFTYGAAGGLPANPSQTASLPHSLMPKMPNAREHHREP